jgi:hypothetical protein
MPSRVKVPVKTDQSLGTFMTGVVGAFCIPYDMISIGSRSAKFLGP